MAILNLSLSGAVNYHTDILSIRRHINDLPDEDHPILADAAQGAAVPALAPNDPYAPANITTITIQNPEAGQHPLRIYMRNSDLYLVAFRSVNDGTGANPGSHTVKFSDTLEVFAHSHTLLFTGQYNSYGIGSQKNMSISNYKLQIAIQEIIAFLADQKPPPTKVRFERVSQENVKQHIKILAQVISESLRFNCIAKGILRTLATYTFNFDYTQECQFCMGTIHTATNCNTPMLIDARGHKQMTPALLVNYWKKISKSVNPPEERKRIGLTQTHVHAYASIPIHFGVPAHGAPALGGVAHGAAPHGGIAFPQEVL